MTRTYKLYGEYMTIPDYARKEGITRAGAHHRARQQGVKIVQLGSISLVKVKRGRMV